MKLLFYTVDYHWTWKSLLKLPDIHLIWQLRDEIPCIAMDGWVVGTDNVSYTEDTYLLWELSHEILSSTFSIN